MKQFFTFFTALLLGSTVMAQAVFQSDFSSWAAGAPTDWVGSKTNLAASNITQVSTGATYGTDQVNLVNTGSGHKRFTSQPFSVTGGTIYEVQMWITGNVGEVRAAYYDLTNAAYVYDNGNYIDVSTSSAGTQTMVFQTINVVSTCSDMELIISLRNTDSLGFMIDSISVAPPSTPIVPTTLSITQIQDNGGGMSMYEDSVVITSGVVTAINAGVGYWIQDGMGPYTGIFIKDDVNTPSRGDSVTVTGIVAEIFGITQIEFITAFTTEPAPVVAITPTIVSTYDINNLEDWEGVLVKVQNGECINEDAGFGQWTLNDGAALADSVLVDDDLYSYAAVLGQMYNVTGIGHYSYGASKLLPRDAADITTGTSGIEKESVNFSVYPNPATSHVVISSSNQAIISIYNISGAVLYSNTVNNKKVIHTSDFVPGIYMIQLKSGESIQTRKLIIR